jgi:hypothetical protein
MKFNCGLTTETKRILKRQSKATKLERAKNWHRVFALFPIQISDNDCRWFEYVERSYPDAFVGRTSGHLWKINQNIELNHEI